MTLLFGCMSALEATIERDYPMLEWSAALLSKKSGRWFEFTGAKSERISPPLFNEAIITVPANSLLFVLGKSF